MSPGSAPAHVTTAFELLQEGGAAKFWSASEGYPSSTKCKEGHLRGNLIGNFSVRTAFAADPTLELDEVGVPKSIAMTLTYPEQELVWHGPSTYPGIGDGDGELATQQELENILQDISIQLSLTNPSQASEHTDNFHSRHSAQGYPETSHSLEYPRHDPNPHHGSIFLAHGPAIPADRSHIDYEVDSQMYSYRTAENEDGIQPYGGDTMSTVAHHASALTLRAGLVGKGATRRTRTFGDDVSLSGAEYDPDRPFERVMKGIIQDTSMFGADSERFKPRRKQSNREPTQNIFKPAGSSKKMILTRLRRQMHFSFQAVAIAFRQYTYPRKPALNVQPSTPSTAGNGGGSSKFTKMAKDIARDIETSQRKMDASVRERGEKVATRFIAKLREASKRSKGKGKGRGFSYDDALAVERRYEDVVEEEKGSSWESNVAGGFEVLRGVIGEGLEGRRRVKDASKPTPNSPQEQGHCGDVPRDGGPADRSHNTTNRSRLPRQHSERRAEPQGVDKTIRTDRATDGWLHVDLEKAGRYVEDEEIDRVTEELEEMRSERSQSTPRSVPPCHADFQHLFRTGLAMGEEPLKPPLFSPKQHERTVKQWLDLLIRHVRLPTMFRGRVDADSSVGETERNGFDLFGGDKPLQTVLTRVLQELEDDFARYKSGLAEPQPSSETDSRRHAHSSGSGNGPFIKEPEAEPTPRFGALASANTIATVPPVSNASSVITRESIVGGRESKRSLASSVRWGDAVGVAIREPRAKDGKEPVGVLGGILKSSKGSTKDKGGAAGASPLREEAGGGEVRELPVVAIEAASPERVDETPMKKAKPRSVSDQLLGRGRPKGIIVDGDGDGVMTIVEQLPPTLRLSSTDSTSRLHVSTVLPRWIRASAISARRRRYAEYLPAQIGQFIEEDREGEGERDVVELVASLHADPQREGQLTDIGAGGYGDDAEQLPVPMSVVPARPQNSAAGRLIGQEIAPWKVLNTTLMTVEEWNKSAVLKSDSPGASQVKKKPPPPPPNTVRLIHKRPMSPPEPALQTMLVFQPLRPVKSRSLATVVRSIPSPVPVTPEMSDFANQNVVSSPSNGIGIVLCGGRVGCCESYAEGTQDAAQENISFAGDTKMSRPEFE
ncbi:hypothetical protein BD410DRAFT_883210 [Rickenella mellea]|uniref:Uncharacterized protein n=1 Tax=Rickenella mellea TaxID=50990 RepID=A0A4Y7PQA9_9AGAM|nr:hypothetical protein BD410DRAFT_883210 [Rickenella mellea]